MHTVLSQSLVPPVTVLVTEFVYATYPVYPFLHLQQTSYGEIDNLNISAPAP